MAGITLSKGGNLSLTKQDPTMTRVVVGLGWDPRATSGQEFDLDASAFLLGQGGKVRSEADFIFYNQLSTPDRSVEHTGDNRTGDGDGDDEQVRVDLARVQAGVQTIAFTVTIHDAEARRQNFGQVRNAFIRIVNEDTAREIARFDLGEDFSTETAAIFGEIYRYGGEWKFRAVGQGFSGGLRAMCHYYGIHI